MPTRRTPADPKAAINSDRPEDYPHAKTIIDALASADRLGAVLERELARGQLGAARRCLSRLRAAIKTAEDAICSIFDEEMTLEVGPPDIDADPPPCSIRIADWGKIVTAAAETLAETLEPPAGQVDGPDPRD